MAKYDFMSFGEPNIRMSPPEHDRLGQGDELKLGIAAAELNCCVNISNLSVEKLLPTMKTAYVTKLVDNWTGRYIVTRAQMYGVDMSNVVVEPYDKIGRTRNGLAFIEVGIGPRPSYQLYDRGHTALSKIQPGDIDVILGNEEDFDTMLGIKADNTDENFSSIDPMNYKKVAEKVMAKYPHIKVVGTSLREVKTALLNNWQGCMMTRDGFFVSRKYENIEINDRVGGGDSFASALIYSMLQGYDGQRTIDFATAFSALCHTIRNDWNLVSRQEAESLAAGGSARVKR